MSVNTVLLHTAGCFIFAFWFFLGRRSPSNLAGKFDIPGSPIVLAWLFFTKRYDFISDTFKKTGQKMFRFRVLQNIRVSAYTFSTMSLLFLVKKFNFREGYRVLGEQAPELRDINIKTEESSNFAKLVLNLFRKERVKDSE
ncbi:hypothetical protein C8R45DRAFT_820277 [Mycena sanguinolenta]|nr:hypothetical protein C8R45DRAFT_820277 [Mycena sanguinolenta]